MGGATSCFASEDNDALEYDTEESPNNMDVQSVSPRRGAPAEAAPDVTEIGFMEDCEWTGPEGAPRIASQVPLLGPGDQPPADQPSWCPVPGSAFRVRCGPAYDSNGIKTPSLPALYDCVGMDIYKSKKPIYHIASQLALPTPPHIKNSGCVPSTIVLNVMVPTSAPSMFSQKSNGETINVVFCFVMRESTARQLEALEEASAAVRLLDSYFRYAPHGHAAVANRFKLMGKVNNWDEAGLPGVLQGFNGKPTLVTKSGMWYSTWGHGQGYAELDCNTAHWCYMARKGLSSSWKTIGLAQFDFGVVIEARDDAEMPEQVLGSAHINHVKLDGPIPQWKGTCGAPTGAATRWQCNPEQKKAKK